MSFGPSTTRAKTDQKYISGESYKVWDFYSVVFHPQHDLCPLVQRSFAISQNRHALAECLWWISLVIFKCMASDFFNGSVKAALEENKNTFHAVLVCFVNP